ncbi:pectinesterase family protein [Propioniciclava soli]|uniref:Pectinesterase family protein n=1 Tax=Propioniciclava soli TaxID=2775081 RepID=A0ABZ3C5N6_9ACTN
MGGIKRAQRPDRLLGRLVAALTVTAIVGAGPGTGAAIAAEDTTPPAPVAKLTATGDKSRVKLDWSSNKEKDLRGYQVYRAESADGSFTRLTSSPRTSSDFSDTSAPTGVVSYYRVTAIDKSGNESAPSAVSAVRKDATAPAAPTGATVVLTGTTAVLDWADSREADLAGYLVQRATTAGGTYRSVTPSPIQESTFTDATGAATSFYRVAAVDTSGNVSSWTKVSAPDTIAPAPVTGMVVTTSSSRIKLDWTSSSEKDRAGYHVYRASTPDGPFTRLTATPRTSSDFSDYEAAVGLVWHYRVTVIDKAGNESEPVSASAIRKDAVAPAAPTGLTATQAATGVVLDWADNTEPDVAGYRVWRTGPDGVETLLADQVPASTLTDGSAPTGALTYRVVALDASGNVSAAASATITVTAPIEGATVVVAQDGSGDFTTVTDALAAAPADGSAYVIGIRPGTYTESFTVARANVTLLGATANAADVVISGDVAAGTPKPDGTGTYGTSGSATVLIRGNDVTVKNLTIENAYVETGTGSEQAVALKTQGDRLVFANVRLLGDQDTLYADSPAPGALARSYYTNSYIEGDVDFIFGRGTAVFDRSTLMASSRGSTTNNGYVTAASTSNALPYGFLITDSTILSDAPDQTFSLGRPWQPSGDVTAIAQVVVRNTELPAAIKSSPWTDMTTSFSWRNARFFEYANTGPGAGVNADRPQLSTVEAASYTKFTYLAGTDGWNPTGELPPADTTPPAAPAGLTATAGDSVVDLAWTANTDADLAGYTVYRSTTSPVATTAENLVAADLTAPTLKDRGVTNGVTYHYVVTAVDRQGNQSPASAEVAAAPVGVPLPPHDALVSADGSGDFTTVQAAIDQTPAGTADHPVVIVIRPGVYRELVSVKRPYVQLVGATGVAADVVLTYDNAAGTTNPATGQPYGTGNSQSVLVTGANVTVKDLTIENAFDEAASSLTSKQAVALKTTGDRAVYSNVRLLGNQDTLLADTPDPSVISRAYFVNSWIEGDVDFIFGRGTAVFDRTTIRALSRGSSSNNGYITAASTSDKNPYGFLIVNSTVTSDAPAGTFSLGRPWRGWSDGYTRNGVVYNSRGQVTIRNTTLPAAIRATQPWADMAPNLWTDGRFFEYDNTGAGATVVDPATRPQLTDAAANDATPQAYLAGSDGWDPIG